MANYKTGAQRYNDRLDKIWDKARQNGAFINREKLADLVEEFFTEHTVMTDNDFNKLRLSLIPY